MSGRFPFNKKNMDTYLDHKNVVKRLVDEYRFHEGLVVAYDFDNTVYDYRKKGDTYDMVVDLLRTLEKVPGISFVVWTGTANERHDFVRAYLQANDIPYHTINENPSFFKSSSRKIFYSILLDDRAGLVSAYNALVDFLNEIGVQYFYKERS